MLQTSAWAGKLSILIDDFGYRPQEENKILALPDAISVAVLPNAPHSYEMATKAHKDGHEVLIHLPMAPLSKQPLEKDTLKPEMSRSEIARIIHDAVNKVPFATGVNNHMGSAMTSNFSGMQKVMQTLSQYNLYFLDSMTIGNSQATRAAAGTGVKVIKRKVFLDNKQNETDIRIQLNRAIELARRNGFAIAIGHPHPTTVRVLQQAIYHLPRDITLVRTGSLLNEPPLNTTPPLVQQQPRKQPGQFTGIKLCKFKRPLHPIHASTYFTVIGESIAQGSLVNYFKQQWQGWKNQP